MYDLHYSKGHDPQYFIDQIAASGRRLTTPCGTGQLVWRVWGAGPPLVLLHGAFGSWLHWIRNVGDLGKAATVIVPDMPGYGESDLPDMPHTAEDLAKLLDPGVGTIVPAPAKLDLAGFSFGGIVAGHLAARLGDQVSNLILIGPNGISLTPGRPGPLLNVTSGMDEGAVANVHRHNLGVLMIADPRKVDALAVRIQVANAAKSRFKSGAIPLSDSLLRALPSVRARIRGIWGESDAMAAPFIHQRKEVLRRFQPDLDFRLVPRAGHWVIYEAPEATNAAITEMIDRSW